MIGKTFRQGRARLRLAIGLAALAATVACAPIYRNHGYIPSEEELSAIQVGVTDRAAVETEIGAASTGSVLNDGDLYYVRSRVRHFAYREPEVIERQVLAISFDGADRVQNIERFSLADGKVVPLARRVTSSSVQDKSFLRQLMGNLGRFNPADFLNN